MKSTHWRLTTDGVSGATYYFIAKGIEFYDSQGVRNELVPTSASMSVGHHSGSQAINAWDLAPTPRWLPPSGNHAEGTGGTEWQTGTTGGSPTEHWNAAIFASPVEVKTWSVWTHPDHDGNGNYIMQYSKDNGVTWEEHSRIYVPDHYLTPTLVYGYSWTDPNVVTRPQPHKLKFNQRCTTKPKDWRFIDVPTAIGYGEI